MVQKSGLAKIIIIAGPTASGKTELSLKCAQHLDGEIVGCDSMQIYSGMDIGTGKLPVSQRRKIKHFMIDIIPPEREFSVSEYVRMAEGVISDIAKRGKLPIVVGGTGLYINGLLNGLNYAVSPKSTAVRKKYDDILSERGREYLFDILKKVDPEESAKLNVNDTKRVIRALEIYETTGIPKSKAVKKTGSNYDYKMITLSPQRDKLYAAINNRVDTMISAGLIDEVRGLYDFRHCQSMQAIGYKELIAYLDGKESLEQAVEKIKTNTRHYAKRQLTYFRHMDAEMTVIQNYEKSCDDEIIKTIKAHLANGGL